MIGLVMKFELEVLFVIVQISVGLRSNNLLNFKEIKPVLAYCVNKLLFFCF